MKIGLVGYPGAGKSTVFNALTGLSAATGYGAKDKSNLGTVKVPDDRVDALAKLYSPKKTTYAEITFSDVGGGGGEGLDRKVLNDMREVDALCHVVRGFAVPGGDAPDPMGEISGLEVECILADLEIVERRCDRLKRDRSDPRELEILESARAHLEGEKPLRSMGLDEAALKQLSGYRFLTVKPLLLALNVGESDAAADVPADIAAAAEERGLGLVVLSAQIEMDIAQMEPDDQREFLESLGLSEPASGRFIRAAYALIDLISMLTHGEDECRAWPVPRGSLAPAAAGKIHSDIERGFIRAEVIRWEDLIELGSESRCRDQGKLRVEGKSYVVQDGDCVNFRFNV